MSEYEIRLLYSIVNNNNNSNSTLKNILDEFVENKTSYDLRKNQTVLNS
jgi:hypothetical protein